ncbi:MAG: helix-turn-helix domain-containing protein [Agriterribacter sp.]
MKRSKGETQKVKTTQQNIGASYSINSRKQYHETMLAIYVLMDKGEANLSVAELQKLGRMSAAAEQYEDEVLKLQPQKQPATISELVELKLFEQKMTQARLASKIGISQSKVSEILAGKRKPDIPFLKGIHKILNLDAEFLLKHA